MKTRTSSPARCTWIARAVELPLDGARAEPLERLARRRRRSARASAGAGARPRAEKRPSAARPRRSRPRRPRRGRRPASRARRTAAARRRRRSRPPRASRPRARPGAARRARGREERCSRSVARANSVASSRAARLRALPARPDAATGRVHLEELERRRRPAGAGRSRSAAQPTPIGPCGSAPERYATATRRSPAPPRRRHSARSRVFSVRADAAATSAETRAIPSSSTSQTLSRLSTNRAQRWRARTSGWSCRPRELNRRPCVRGSFTRSDARRHALPVVLDSEDSRAVLIRIAPGQELGEHQVRERAGWLSSTGRSKLARPTNRSPPIRERCSSSSLRSVTRCGAKAAPASCSS